MNWVDDKGPLPKSMEHLSGGLNFSFNIWIIFYSFLLSFFRFHELSPYVSFFCLWLVWCWCWVCWWPDLLGLILWVHFAGWSSLSRYASHQNLGLRERLCFDFQLTQLFSCSMFSDFFVLNQKAGFSCFVRIVLSTLLKPSTRQRMQQSVNHSTLKLSENEKSTLT